jgi:DNA-binding response OmpR family regulator
MAPLKIMYLEDNPLIAFHVEQMVEDAGHLLVAVLQSFEEMKQQFTSLQIDAALVDVDLADGRTGPLAAEWLSERKIPVIFVTGQEKVALEFSHLAMALVRKPISASDLAEKIAALDSA